MSSLSFTLFQGLEVLTANASNFEAVYKEFADQAEDIKGRLYAMLKKLNNEGPVNTEIHYLKARYLVAPSKLVLDISERVLDQILFNEKVCKYETKQLNRVIAHTACEEHVQAIENLLKNKKSFSDAINNLKDGDTKEAKIVCRNFRQVGKHLCWSSRRLLANIRIGETKSNESLESSEDKAPEYLYLLGDETFVKQGFCQYGKAEKNAENPKHWDGEFELYKSPDDLKKSLKKSMYIAKSAHYAFGLPTSKIKEHLFFESGKWFFRPQKDSLRIDIKDMKVVDLGDVSKDDLKK